MKKIFRRQKPLKTVRRHHILAMDVENDPETGAFICAALFGDVKDSHKKVTRVDRYFSSQSTLFEYLDKIQKNNKNTACRLVFFNMGYDYWFNIAITDDSKLLVSGSRFISGRLKNGIEMMDIANHVDGTLENWIEYLNMEEKGIYKPDLTDLKLRVTMDTRATYHLAIYIQDFYNDVLGIPLSLTIASGARRTFSQHFFTDFWVREDPKLDILERMSYRGGRTEVFRRGDRHVFSYDVNSMYLSAMRDEEYPDPNSAKLYKFPKELPPDRQYIAACTVHVPDQFIPPLPYSKEKLIFPVGTFSGVWCSPELEYAIKECGVTVSAIEWVIRYKSKPYFRAFANFVWTERLKYKKDKNKGMDKMIKKIGNSLYGSFGQRNKLLDYIGKSEDCNITLQEGDKVILTMIDGVEYTSISNAAKEDSNHTFPCVPSFVTAFARVKLLKRLKLDEPNAVYCDTDCVKSLTDLGDASDDLGGWGFEESKSGDFYFIRPKLYGRVGSEIPEKMKGIPKKNVDLLENTDDHYKFGFKKPNRMRESINRDLTPNQWIYHTKTVRKEDDKRVWSGEESRPIVLT